jgi:nucleoside phosphorylase
MIKVLVIDDSQRKAKNIIDLLNNIPGCCYELATDIVTARRYLQEFFHLAIVDMNLPERFSDTPKEDAGLTFILEIKKSKRIKTPEHFIGLTEIPTIHDKYKGDLDDNLVSLIKYDETKDDWRNKIKSKIRDLVEQKQNNYEHANYIYDVGIVTALSTPELEAVLKLKYNWTKVNVKPDSSNYWEGKIVLSDGRILNIVATPLPQMGMVATASSAMKVITHFKPRYLIMTGICGGVEEKVNLGDIVISDLSFDFDSGKIIDNNGAEEFESDYRSIPLDSRLKDKFMSLSNEKEILRAIKDSWEGNGVNNDLKIVLRPVGSVAAVISNADYISNKIKHQRKMVAIDMETYAIFYSCMHSVEPKPTAISIKSVSDHANAHKNDDLQKYCSYISAKLADYIIQNILFE